MKVKAEKVPYSSVVGGIVTLHGPRGEVVSQLGIRGVNRDQSDEIAEGLVKLINKHGLSFKAEKRIGQ